MFRKICKRVGILIVAIVMCMQFLPGSIMLAAQAADSSQQIQTALSGQADAETETMPEQTEESKTEAETMREEETDADKEETTAKQEQLAEESTTVPDDKPEEDTTAAPDADKSKTPKEERVTDDAQTSKQKEKETGDEADKNEGIRKKYTTEEGLIVFPETRPLLAELFSDKGVFLNADTHAAGSADDVSGIRLNWEIYNTGMDAWWPVSNGSVTRDANWTHFTTDAIADLMPGDVIVWDYGGMWVGHIAIVTEVASDASWYKTADGNTGSATGVSIIKRTDTWRSGASSMKVLIWRNRVHGKAIADSAESFAAKIIENSDMKLKNTYGSINWCYCFVVEALLQVEAGYLKIAKEKEGSIPVAGAVYRVYDESKSTVEGWFVTTDSGQGRVVKKVSAEEVKSFDDITSDYTAETERGKFARNIVTASATYSFGRLNPSGAFWYCSTGSDTMELKANTTYYLKEYLTPINQKYELDESWNYARTKASSQPGGEYVQVDLKDELVPEKPGYLKLVKEREGSLSVAGAVYNVFQKDKETLAGRFILTGSGEGRVVKRLTSDMITSYDDATAEYTTETGVGKFGRNIVADGVTYSFGRSTPGGGVWYVSTGASSMELKKGTYYVKEAITPLNQKYGLDEEFYQVVITPEQTETVTCRDEVSGGIRLVKSSIPEEAAEKFTLRGALYHLYKNYENGEYSGYAGFSFIVKNSSGTGYIAYRTEEEEEAKKHAYYVDRGSAFYYTDWDLKEIASDADTVYYVKEAAGPDTGRYELAQPEKSKVEVRAGETYTIYAADPIKKGKVTLQKTSVPQSASAKEGYGLKGALYNLYKNEAMTSYAGVSFITDDAGTGYLATRTTDKDSIPQEAYVRTAKSSTNTYYFWTLFEQTEAELDYGTYYYRERLAPENGHYEITEPDDNSVTVSPDRTIGIEGKDRLLYMDRVKTLLMKTDADKNKAQLENMSNPQGSGCFSGAEFTLQYYSSIFQKAADAPKTAVRTWVYQTDAAGVLDFSDEKQKVSGDSLYYDQDNKPSIPQGTVVIEETKAPEGYLRNEDKLIVTIEIAGIKRTRTLYDENGKLLDTQEVPNVTQAADTQITVEETVVKGGVKLAKLDAETDRAVPLGEAVLSDAEFSIYNLGNHAVLDAMNNEISAAESAEEVSEGNLVMRIYTDQNGIAQTDAHALPYGTYLVKETKAPRGYLLNTDWQKVFEIREDGVYADLQEEAVKDQVLRRDVRFEKTIQTAAGKQPFAGVLWEVTAAATGETHYIVTDKQGVFDSGAVKKNNGNDKAVIKKDDGSYEIDETLLAAENGVWFSGSMNSGTEDVGDKTAEQGGSFVYGNYLFRELETSVNKGGSLISFTADVYETEVDQAAGDVVPGSTVLELGEKTDSASPEKSYEDPKMTQATPVYPGKEIAYRLYWSNTKAQEAEVTAYDTLSKGLAYVEGSASIEPTQIMQNTDGTTTLIWKLGKQPQAGAGIITYHALVTEDIPETYLVANDYELQYNNDPRQKIRSLSNPIPHYTMEKHRMTEAPQKERLKKFGFRNNDSVSYEVKIVNDGAVDLFLSLTDAFAQKAKEYFSDLKLVKVRGAKVLDRTDAVTAQLFLKAGRAAVVTYRAVVAEDVPEYLAPAAKDNKEDDADGYRNTARVCDVKAVFEDANGKEIQLTKKDTPFLEDKEDTADTPVQVPEVTETTVPETTTAQQPTTTKPQVTTRQTATTRRSSVKTGDEADVVIWIIVSFGACGLIILSVRSLKKRQR